MGTWKCGGESCEPWEQFPVHRGTPTKQCQVCQLIAIIEDLIKVMNTNVAPSYQNGFFNVHDIDRQRQLGNEYENVPSLNDSPI